MKAFEGRPAAEAYEECPDLEECCLVRAFLSLTDDLISDIRHLKAETIRARCELREQLDPAHESITDCDMLSNLDAPHYDNPAYRLYAELYYDGGDPMAFRDYVDSISSLAKGIDDGKY